jgi:hypothetical protein
VRKSPLRRLTPLSSQLQRLPRKAKAKPGAKERNDWKRQFDHCMCCLRREPLDTHEIAPRSRTERCFELANLLALCRGCHDVLQGTDAITQAAFKFLEDPETFDLVALNRLRQRAGEAITHQEVKQRVFLIQAIRGR